MDIILLDEIIRRYCTRTDSDYYAFWQSIYKILRYRGINDTMPMYDVAVWLVAKDVIQIRERVV